MKVLLVCKSKKMENLGVMYLSAVAKNLGHECKIVELDDALIVTKMWNPDIIGYSIMTGNQRTFKVVNEEISRWAEWKKRPVKRIVGGPHPTFFPDDFANSENIDVIIPGEGEEAFAEILGSSHAPGTKMFPAIDDFPCPDRTDFPKMKIRDFISSRGCPFNCSYCYNEKWAELYPDIPRVRTRTVDSVIKEIGATEPEFVYFQDSCFGVNNNWLREFSRKYRAKINIPYHCHMRPAQITEERTLLLHDSNCMSVRIALESASDRLRKLLNRDKLDKIHVLEAAKRLKKWNIELMVQNMIGIPTGTIEDDMETLEFNVRCKPTYAWVSIYSPYPGTSLGDQCKNNGWYTGDYSDISDNFFKTSVLEIDPIYKEQLECLQKIFALCVDNGFVPDIEELTHLNFEDLVHKIMRRKGDKKLYGNVIR